MPKLLFFNESTFFKFDFKHLIGSPEKAWPSKIFRTWGLFGIRCYRHRPSFVETFYAVPRSVNEHMSQTQNKEPTLKTRVGRGRFHRNR